MRARLIVLCDFVRGTIVVQLMIERRRFRNDWMEKLHTRNNRNIVFFNLLFIAVEISFFIEKKVLLMSLENF